MESKYGFTRPVAGKTGKARAQVVTFLILTAVLSAVTYAPMIAARSFEAGQGLGIFAVMWSPGVAAIVTRLIWQRNLRGFGWGWGPTRYQLFAYLGPPLAALIVYACVWLTGLGGFDPDRLTRGR